MSTGIRLNKYLAKCGLGSRRSVEELISGGCVRVNGAVVTDFSFRVGEEDEVEIGEVGSPAQAAKPGKPMILMLNKPAGYLCSRTDPFGRPLIYTLIPTRYRHLHHVGRLDFQSRGLLLLTNDGDLTQVLLHPSTGVPRTYFVKTQLALSANDMLQIRSGLEIDPGFRTKPAEISKRKEGYQITLREGKKREIRKMLELLGHRVVDLQRVAFGKVRLDELPEGETRLLDESEIEFLYNEKGTVKGAGKENPL